MHFHIVLCVHALLLLLTLPPLLPLLLLPAQRLRSVYAHILIANM
jgi:hypothetical protein